MLIYIYFIIQKQIYFVKTLLQYVLNNTSHTDESFWKKKIQYQTRMKILQ
jgi:hypothetical protein